MSRLADFRRLYKGKTENIKDQWRQNPKSYHKPHRHATANPWLKFNNKTNSLIDVAVAVWRDSHDGRGAAPMKTGLEALIELKKSPCWHCSSCPSWRQRELCVGEGMTCFALVGALTRNRKFIRVTVLLNPITSCYEGKPTWKRACFQIPMSFSSEQEEPI